MFFQMKVNFIPIPLISSKIETKVYIGNANNKEVVISVNKKQARVNLTCLNKLHQHKQYSLRYKKIITNPLYAF